MATLSYTVRRWLELNLVSKGRGGEGRGKEKGTEGRGGEERGKSKTIKIQGGQ